MYEENNKVPEKEIEQSKKDRIKAYNDFVRKQHKNIFDHHQNHHSEAAKGEAISHKKFTRRVRQLNGSLQITDRGRTNDSEKAYESTDLESRPRKSHSDIQEEGLKNLRHMKSMVEEHLQKQKFDNYKPEMHFILEK